ncbi:FMN-dependent NADH-azoreductase [Silvibacterium acidisoli]|uniref:FMN-dependent NADH-azoreductase n=1 Tax=Acidobacteriaceae bacterium ZG23-2 TaxID=2883246 RepID=UPI00406C4E66
MNILHIQSSPRAESSNSIELTNAFISACQATKDTVSVDTLNVWTENLPEFDAGAIGAKYKAIKGVGLDARETEVWTRIQSLIGRFQKADRILLGAPMWNFSVPYKLKQLIDLVAQRNFLFTYDGNEYGLALSIDKAITLYTRGSQFLEGSAIPASRFDHQAPYIDFWLSLIGVHNLRSVIVDKAWNLDAKESELSIADGKKRLLENVDWFLS